MISMIIPCYWADLNLIDMTMKCLNGALIEDIDQYLVIDDGSPMQLDLIDDTDFDDTVEVITRKRNGGYAAAVNTGLFYSVGDTMIICNNDIEFVDPSWLDCLLEPLRGGYHISSIRTTDSDGWLTEDKITEGDKFGSIWAIKREVYETIGGLDESFGNYFEDLDYHKRVVDAGFKIAKNHAALVEHKGKATFSVVDPNDEAYEKARRRFKEKHGKVW